jgi:hypothetical protein
LISEILNFNGYSIDVGIIVHGIGIEHEIDLVGEKVRDYLTVECEFHNRPG